MFSPAFFCLGTRPLNSKSTVRIWMKIPNDVDIRPRNRLLAFGGDLEHHIALAEVWALRVLF